MRRPKDSELGFDIRLPVVVISYELRKGHAHGGSRVGRLGR